jgi:hypothetical protein
MNKTVAEYFEASGWSSSLFVEHAKYVFAELKEAQIIIGRTVIHVEKGPKKIKVYVHYAGKSREFVTITDRYGMPIEVYHYKSSPEALLKAIRDHLV